jgi:hypothetical protein
MNRFVTILSCAIAASSITAWAPDAARAEARLYPTLAPFQFMVGSWQCKSWTAASGRGGARLDAITARYSVEGGGAALGQHVIGPDYRTFELFGYQP